MREISNNSNNVNFPKVENRMEIPRVPDSEQQETSAPSPQTKDLSLQPQAVIGRSMVSMTGATGTDNLGEDMKIMLEKPEATQKAMHFFDVAYERLKAQGEEEPYEKAAELTNAVKKDFVE